MRTPGSRGGNPGASVFQGSQAKGRPPGDQGGGREHGDRCRLSGGEEAADAVAEGLGSRAELVFRVTALLTGCVTLAMRYFTSQRFRL